MDLPVERATCDEMSMLRIADVWEGWTNPRRSRHHNDWNIASFLFVQNVSRCPDPVWAVEECHVDTAFERSLIVTTDAVITTAIDPLTILDALAGWERVEAFLTSHSRSHRQVRPLGPEHEYMLRRGVRHPRPRFREMAVRLGLDLPSIVECGAVDRFRRVRQAAATSPRLTAATLMALSGDVCEKVRKAVAENPSTPVEAAIGLLGDGHADVRRAAAHHTDLPENLLFELARDRDPEVRHAVALNLRSSGEALHRVATRLRVSRLDTELALARHPKTPLADLMKLAETASEQVRWELGAFRNEPEVLISLVKDPRVGVHHRVLENPAAPAALLENFPSSLGIDVHERAAEHPNASPEVYRRFAAHYLSLETTFHQNLGIGLVRRGIARFGWVASASPSPSLDTPVEVLEAFFGGRTTKALTEWVLIHDEPVWLRRFLIDRLTFTPQEYQMLATDPSPLIRARVPGDYRP
jgi:hypothetical protein